MREFWQFPQVVISLAFHPDCSRFALGLPTRCHNLLMWEGCKGGSRIADLMGHTDYVVSLDFSSDGTKLLSASKDQTIRCVQRCSFDYISEFLVTSQQAL